MFCKNCGVQIPDFSAQCPVCHANTAPQSQQNYQNNGYNSQPNYSSYGTEYGGYAPNYIQYNDIVDKGNTAKTLAIVGLILGIVTTPILGWILGGIALSYSKRALAVTGNPIYKSTVITARWAIGAACAIAVLHIIAVIVYLVLFTAMLEGATSYDTYNYDSYSAAFGLIKSVSTFFV